MARELCDLVMTLHHETDLAVLVSDDGDEDAAVWLPKSVIEMEEGARKNPESVEITMPIWLAKKHNLI